jgi:hypothetical protein
MALQALLSTASQRKVSITERLWLDDSSGLPQLN